MQVPKNADFLPVSLVDSFFQSDYFYSPGPFRAPKELPKEPAAAYFTNRLLIAHFLFTVKSLSTPLQCSKHTFVHSPSNGQIIRPGAALSACFGNSLRLTSSRE